MALEALIDSNYPLEICSMKSSQVSGDLVQSSNSDNVQQKDRQFPDMLASLFGTLSGNTIDISSKIPQPNVGGISSSTNSTTLNSLTNLELSVGTGSSLTGVNSTVLRGPNMQRSAVTDMDRLNLPVLPFSLHNSSISGFSTTNDSSIAQEDFHLGQNCSLVKKRKHQQGCFSTKSQSGKSHKSFLNGEKHELSTSDEMCKKLRLDIKQDAVLYQHIAQQQLQSGDKVQLQSHSPLLQTLIQQHKLEHQRQQKMLQFITDLPGVEMKKQRQQQMRDYLQQLELQQVHQMHPINSNICSRRLSQYMYHLQHRPPENRIAYWRKFVAEYFAPCAKKRWCLSLCHSVRLRAINLFPQAAMDTWKCELCGTKSGRGFEATFEMLPRLNKVQFESGIFDELLFLELPREYGLPSGLMVLEYGKAVHETVFEQFRIIREGQLRIVFTLDLKILSWEFCSRDHEELLHRSLIASQVNKFVHAAQKYQAAISNGGSDKTSSHNQEENQAMLLSAGCKLGKKFDIQLVGELGFPKRFIRCLQIADIFNSMRDLMTLSWKNKIGPIESLKNYSQKITETKLQKDEFQAKEKLDILQGMATDATNLSSTSHGHNSNGNDNSNISKDGLLTSSEKAALAHPGDYCKLLRQTSLSSNISKLKESSCLFMFTDHKGAFQDPNSLKLDFSHNLTRPSSHFPESTRNLQDAMIQKLLLEMFNDCEAMNQAEKEAVNHNINSVLASKMTNAKGTGTSGDATTSKSGIVAKASGFVEAASFMDSSKDCGITREPTLQKRSILPEVLAMFNGLKENEIAKVIHGSSIGYDWKT